jgi:hypothetical protein
VKLIKVWLRNRFFYVSIDAQNSVLFDLILHTVQGSILGPVLYTIFKYPFFNIEKQLAFADDTFFPRWNKSLQTVIVDLEKSLETITKWMHKSGIKKTWKIQ